MQPRIPLCLFALILACGNGDGSESGPDTVADPDTSTASTAESDPDLDSSGSDSSEGGMSASATVTTTTSATASTDDSTTVTSTTTAPDDTGTTTGETGAGECAPAPGVELPAGTPCDPITPTCAAPLGCHFQEPAGGCTFECVEIWGPGLGVGEQCLYLNDCAPGLACLDAFFFTTCPDGAYCCAEYCDLDAPSCPEGTECSSFFEPFPTPAGWEHIGVCAGA